MEREGKLVANNFNELVDNYFYNRLGELDENRIFFLRDDGVLIYSNFNDDDSDISAGALMGGVWQAAFALLQYMPQLKDEENFRLGFDTSDRGIYILPVIVDGESYLLGMIYNKTINPGALKLKFRQLTFDFENYINENIEIGLNRGSMAETVGVNNENILFNNISDSEIDDIFATL